jgi:hypothetical protein
MLFSLFLLLEFKIQLEINSVISILINEDK